MIVSPDPGTLPIAPQGIEFQLHCFKVMSWDANDRSVTQRNLDARSTAIHGQQKLRERRQWRRDLCSSLDRFLRPQRLLLDHCQGAINPPGP
jgi:hypothetical protein